MASDSGKVLGPGEGAVLSTMGVNLTVKADAGDTDGAFSLMEYEAPAAFGGPPSHRHRQMVEAFYVLEGELELTLDGRPVGLALGGFGLVTPGVVHPFANPSPASVRFLILVSPGGFERFFEELLPIVEEHGYPPPPDVMAELSRRYDVEMTG